MSPENSAWLLKRFVVKLHAAQLTEHGGPSGLRDPGGLDSALARPENLQAYGSPDLAALAASYAFGLARNMPSSMATSGHPSPLASRF